MNESNRITKGTWKKDLRLYVHVPFCVKKCDYCDFLSGPSNEEGIKRYFEALYKEIRSYKDRTKDYFVSTVFIGGGTPSCVASEYIVNTLNELRKVFEFSKDITPEITIEVNPGTLDSKNSNTKDDSYKKKLLKYKNAGINRLSFGLQSTNDQELKLLGRIHSYSQFEENYKLARELGFDNINVDLMSALPGQSLNTWEKTLQRIAKLQPEHISAYSLIIEEGTPFYEMYGPNGIYKDKLPSEDIDRLIYKKTKDILLSYGYDRYEISNYAQKGYECRHNLAYWEGISYLGLGLGSASLIENTRFNNTDILQEYLELLQSNHKNITSITIRDNENVSILKDICGTRKDIEFLTKNQQIEEFMFLGLRKCEGVSISEFKKRFGVAMEYIYSDVLKTLDNEGIIYINNDKVRLTDYGIDISNIALAEFLFD